ncbi:hypothetical protein BU14_0478s0003 [Porphyra umbilicalis]|uniref:J domain-containing protein n=1 Tax=Porphyra umbilicalis TaxID=2786 RepID=A0A1X6NTX9_PORUM|nr:hypothetical protein BU14_0478s0003 [Porphyra umbilicalis]|eukprot:OSX72035.1 hypothetical protein BU14_0478s0003 [Porphyra umbilicalis]
MPERRRRGQDPADAAEASCLSGNVAFHRRDWPVAIRCYTAAIRVRSEAGLPADRRLVSNRSAAWLARAEDSVDDVKGGGSGGGGCGDHPPPGSVGVAACLSHAARDAARCVKVDPTWPKGWFRLHSVFLAAGNELEAAEALRRGLTECPRDEDLKRALARLDGASAKASVAPTKGIAATRLRAPLLPVAPTADGAECGGSAISRSSSSDEAPSAGDGGSPSARLRALGQTRYMAGDWDGAIEAFTEAIAVAARGRQATDAQSLSARSAAYVRKGLAAAGGGGDGSVGGGGGGCSRVGDAMAAACFGRATADAKAVVTTHPTWEDGWLRLGAVHAARGRADMAAEAYACGVAACPSSDALQRAHGVARQQVGRQPVAAKKVSPTTVPLPAEGLPDRHVPAASPAWEQAPSPPQEPVQPTVDASKEPPGVAPEQPRSLSTTSSPLTRSSRASSFSEDHGGDASFGGAKASKTSGWFRRRSSMTGFPRKQSGSPPRPPPLLGGSPGADGGAKAAQAPSRQGAATAATVTHTAMYEVLGVAPDASPAAIRRAYYLAAKQVHPDRNPNDPAATAKFQALAEAYQILSDPDARSRYDAHGTTDGEVLTGEPMDPTTLFTVVFGGDEFMAYTGELQVTTQAANVDIDGNPPDEATLQRIQRERVEALATQLVAALQPWVDGDHNAWHTWAEAETERLAAVNFGAAMLATIGYVYAHTAAMALDGHLPRLLTAGRYATHRQGAQRRAARAAGRRSSGGEARGWAGGGSSSGGSGGGGGGGGRRGRRLSTTAAGAPGGGSAGAPGRSAARSFKALLRGKSGLANGTAARTREEMLVERARALRALGKLFMSPTSE